MEYDFRVTPKNGYLHAVIVGDNTPETVQRYLRQIYESCASSRCPNILVEENLNGLGLDLGDIFGVVAEGSRSVWPVVQRMAYVDVNRHHDLKNMRFAETVAVNRSVNVRVFADVPAAEAWLQQQVNAPPGKP
jgi:hypothetical protein